jgi:hypothetical protein
MDGTMPTEDDIETAIKEQDYGLLQWLLAHYPTPISPELLIKCVEMGCDTQNVALVKVALDRGAVSTTNIIRYACDRDVGDVTLELLCRQFSSFCTAWMSG